MAKKTTSKTTHAVKKASKNASTRSAKSPVAPKRKPADISVTKEQAAEALRKGAEQVKPVDVEKVLEKSTEIEKRFEAGGPLGKFVGELRLLLSLVQDYWRGEYRNIPYYSIAAIIATLLYVLNPFDIIPDLIPVVGYVDDTLVVSTCLALIRQDLHTYRKWKVAR